LLCKVLQERPRDVPLRARLAGVELALGKPDAAAEIVLRLVENCTAHPAGYA
jgi:Fe2+ transport system protein FeoA